jgi:DNA gyrase/topoisomerase IV subunit B
MTEVNDVKILTDNEHTLLRPEMYIGSVNIENHLFFVPINDKFILKEIEIIPGMYKIVNEIIDNAIDEHQRGFCDEIWVSMDTDDGIYSVKDNGRGISPEKHSSGKYVPEVLFTMLRSGTNFNDEKRNTLGMNGVGAALTNIFSSKFTVEIHRDDKVYLQTFSNNNKDIASPQILKQKTKKSGTKVTFIPDKKIFKKPLDPLLLRKRCFELAYMFPELTINLRINGEAESFSGKKFDDFVSMFGEDYCIVDEKKLGIRMALVRGNGEGFSQFSIVNGADTIRGGSHIDYIKELFVDKLKDVMKKNYKIEANANDLSKHLHIINFLKINAPKFDSQTKEKLSTSKDIISSIFDPILSSRKINSIIESTPKLVEQIYESLMSKNEAKELAELKKAQKDIKSKKVPKLIDCSSKDRKNCIIFLTEGDSAVAGLSAIRNTKTHAGLPLRGKVLNVSGMAPKDIIENKEIQTLMAVLGLEFGKSPITISRNRAELNGLRYGNISILTDADHDGSAIRCLLINFFFRFWPELFEHGFITISEAPLYETIHKKTGSQDFFYDKPEFMKFMSSKNSSDYEISYFKGLGSCDKNGWDFFINKSPKMYKVDKDDLAKIKLNMAFGEDAELRKQWLRK